MDIQPSRPRKASRKLDVVSRNLSDGESERGRGSRDTAFRFAEALLGIVVLEDRIGKPGTVTDML